MMAGYAVDVVEDDEDGDEDEADVVDVAAAVPCVTASRWCRMRRMGSTLSISCGGWRRKR